MSLPSQIGRITPAGSGGRSRSYMVSKRKRGRSRRLMVMALMLGMGGVIAFAWMQKPPAGGAVEAATVTSNETDEPGAAEPDGFPFGFGSSGGSPEAKLPPASVELTMGGRVEGPEREEAAQDEPDAPKRAPETLIEEQAEAPAEQAAPIQQAPAVEPAQAAEPAQRSISVIDAARRELDKNNPVGARSLLETVLRARHTPEAVRDQARAMIGDINDDLIFSPRLYPDEPLTERYRIKGGDSLSRIASRQGLATDWRLIQRVNQISNPTLIREGQTLKLVRGPFHAVVYKSDYRMDIFAGPPDEPREWRFVRSFKVGLGEGDSTPTGEFVVREDSKLVNPHWVNPRTGERFGADDPDNPIGERWLGLEGLGEYAALSGYGIHGTIDPESIGRQRSMGCVRLDADDVAIVYELLMEGVSRVTIVE